MFPFVYIHAIVTTAAILDFKKLPHFNALLLHLHRVNHHISIFKLPNAQYTSLGFLWYNEFGSMYGGHLGIS